MRSYLFLVFFAGLFCPPSAWNQPRLRQATPDSVHTLTAQQIMLSEGNVNAIASANGMLFFATQLGVEIYYNGQIIANFSYLELTGKAANNRDEPVRLTVIGDSILEVQDNVGTARINYKQSFVIKDKSGLETLPTIPEKTLYSVDKQSLLRNGRPLDARMPWPADSIICLAYNNWQSQREKGEVLLVATRNEGLYQYHFKPGGTFYFRERLRLPLPDSLPVHIMSLRYLDESDAVVIGTRGRSAWLWSQRRDVVFPQIQDENHLNCDIRAFARVGADLLLAGDDVGRLILYRVYSDKAVRIDERRLPPPNNIERVTAIEPAASTGEVYVATANGTLFMVQVDNAHINKPRQVAVLPRIANKKTPQINCMYFHRFKQKGGQLLVGANNGLWIWSESKFVPIDFLKTAFFVKKKERLYMGGENNVRFLPLNGSLDSDAKPQNLDVPAAIFSHLIFCGGDTMILCTRDRFLYVGHLQGGTVFKSIRQFTDGDGFAYRLRDGGGMVYPAYTIYGGYYSQGYVWVSSNFGIHAFDPRRDWQAPLYYHTSATGLGSPEFNTNSFLAWSSSLLAFGSRAGWALLNTSEALQQHRRKRTEKVAFWRIENTVDGEKDTVDGKANIFRYQKQHYECKDSGALIEFDYGDRNSQVLAVLPDYSLLETPVLRMTDGRDSFLMASGRMVGPEYLLGKKENLLDRLFGRSRTLNINFFDSPQKEPDFVVQLSKKGNIDLWRFISIFCLIGILVVIIIKVEKRRRNSIEQAKRRQMQLEQEKKEQQAEIEKQQMLLERKEMEQKIERDALERTQHKQEEALRNVFLNFGYDLNRAENYEQIYDAMKLTPEAQEVLGSTKISVFVYDPIQECLRCVAHSDANPTDAERDKLTFAYINSKAYDLNDHPIDSVRPAVWLWQHLQREDDTLVVNRAQQEYYDKNGFERPEPTLGRKSESFIFQIIRDTDKKPMAVIAMQNEQPVAYDGATKEKFVDLLQMLSNSIGPALERILKDRRNGIRSGSAKLFSSLVKSRLDNHIVNNYAGAMAAKHEPARNDIDKFIGFVSSVYTAKLFTRLNDERYVIEKYKHFMMLVHKRESIEIEYEYSEKVTYYAIPVFLVFNAVSNSSKHGKRANVKVKVCGNFQHQQGIETLSLMIDDNGQGISDIKSYQEKLRNRKNSIGMIQGFFDDIAELTGYRMTMEMTNRTDANGSIEGARMIYTFPIPLLKEFTKLIKHENKSSIN